MASTIIIPGKDYHNVLYEGLADAFSSSIKLEDKRRKEEEAARRRMAAATRAKGRGRSSKKTPKSLEEMMAWGNVAFGPSIPEGSENIDFERREQGYTPSEQRQHKFALQSKYPLHLQKLHPLYPAKTITDSVKRSSLNTILNAAAGGLTVAQRRDTLANTMMDFAKTSGVEFDEDEFSKGERKKASENVQLVMERIVAENPRLTTQEIIDIYDRILSDPTNLLNIRDVHPRAKWLGGFGMDDVIPLSIEEIYNKVRSELPQDSGQGQQAAPTGQAPNQQFSPTEARARADQLRAQGITDPNEIMRIMRSEGYN
jgi:hypothetical protein